MIVRLAGRGDGVTDDGRHVPLAAPGDVIDDYGAMIRGSHYRDPPCRHFPRCGGCDLQHIDDAAYGDFIVDRIAGALRAQGVEVPQMAAPHLSPPRTRRRASLRAEKIHKRVVIGFNEAESHKIVDMQECHVLLPQLFALVAPIRALLVTLLKDRRTANVRLTWTDQGVDVALEKVTVEGLAADEALTDFATQNRLARLSLDDGYGPQTRFEPEPVTVTFANAGQTGSTVPVALPVGGFLQATADGEAAILRAVAGIVADAGAVADLFAGIGTFALPLSASAKVLAAEGARDAALSLKSAAGRAQRPILVEHRDLFRRPLDVKELGRFDAVVLDPPRAGAKEQVEQLAASAVPRIAYVSCNPATFARDAKALIAGGYRLDAITPVGQFRWSTHAELVGAFVR